MDPLFIPLPRTTLDARIRTLVMGVINTTPDSFSDGGVHYDMRDAVASGLRMLDYGADILDIGGESTRPGSSYVDETEEMRRTIPVIEEIIRERPDAVISIDTRRKNVAETAFNAGAQIINDITGFRDDPDLVLFARDSGAALIVMHMLGTPTTMQQEIRYESFPGDLYRFFEERIALLEGAGVSPEKIILDPGVGFGKTFDQNLLLLNRVDYFTPLGKAILMGPSRKAFLGKILDEPVPGNRDTGTLAAIVAAILRGAAIVRVHDVKPAVQACKVADAVKRERISV